jgi:shikimate kinase
VHVLFGRFAVNVSLASVTLKPLPRPCLCCQFWLHCVRFAGLQLNSDPVPPPVPRDHVQPQQDSGPVVPSIIIIGMRGSGKTCIGLALAQSTSRDFYDCDECMQVHAAPQPFTPNRNDVVVQRLVARGRTLAGYIETSGWDAFRKEEVRVLRDVLGGGGVAPTWSRDGATGGSEQLRAACPVVSTGGGIVETPEVTLCTMSHDVRRARDTQPPLAGPRSLGDGQILRIDCITPNCPSPPFVIWRRCRVVKISAIDVRARAALLPH